MGNGELAKWQTLLLSSKCTLTVGTKTDRTMQREVTRQ